MSRIKRTKDILATVVVVMTLLWIGNAQAATTRTWDGGGTASNWFDAANWDTAVPVAGDTAIITATGGGVVITGQTAVLAAFSIGTNTLTFSDTTNLTAALRADDVNILDQGILTHDINSDTASPWLPDNRVYIECANLTLATGGTIDVSKKGYQHAASNGVKGYGPGGGMGGGGTVRAGGAGYGGRGGTGSSGAAGGVAYGTASTPVDPGSAGGTDYSSGGGEGGGVVRISATGQVTVNGSIIADGETAGSGGGGSGGSIYITCDTFAASSAIIRADGGNPDDANKKGGGGGGRIAIVYSATVGTPTVAFSLEYGTVTFTGQPLAHPGSFHLSDNSFYPASTTFTQNQKLSIQSVTSWAPAELVISNAYVSFLTFTNLAPVGSLTVKSGGTLTVMAEAHVTVGGDIIITNTSTLAFADSSNGVLSAGNDIVLYSGATLTLDSNPYDGGSVAVSVGGDLNLASGATISANGAGFKAGDRDQYAGYGPGGGDYGLYKGGGGGYGGQGGGGANASSGGGDVYGYSNAPAFPGSGGSASTTTAAGGGHGGGFVNIEVAGVAAINGAISANGSSSIPGGGSGGAIFIRCDSITGSGALSADGGNGNTDKGGGGGGGRICVWYDNIPEPYLSQILATNLEGIVIASSNVTFSGTTSVDVGISWTGATLANQPEPGTVVFLTADVPPSGTVISIR